MSNLPIFSIIFPIHDWSRQLAACPESIANQTYQSYNFEVIVIDDGSKTPITPVVSKYHDRLNLTLIPYTNRGPALATKTGAVKARDRYLTFTEDNCAPAPDWLQKLEERLYSNSDLMVGGRSINAMSVNAYSIASQDLINISWIICRREMLIRQNAWRTAVLIRLEPCPRTRSEVLKLLLIKPYLFVCLSSCCCNTQILGNNALANVYPYRY